MTAAKKKLTHAVRSELVNAWTEWDLRPGNPDCTSRFIRARRTAAEQLVALPEPHLGDVLMAWRRAGLKRDACVIALVAGVEATRTEPEGTTT